MKLFNWYKHNKGYKIVFSFFLLMFLADLISTLLIKSDVTAALETNPLFRLTGTLLAPIALNIIVIALLLFLMKATPFARFVGIQCMVVISFVRFSVVKANLHWFFNPVTVSEAVQIATEAAKTEYYTTLAISIYALVIIAIISFSLWKMDHNVTKKELKEVRK